MKKNNFGLILIILLIPFVVSCGGEVREALEGKKRSEQSDEFLVKKKNPLQMPPDIYKLPQPGDGMENDTANSNNDNQVKELLKMKDNKELQDTKDDSQLINKMLKKIE